MLVWNLAPMLRMGRLSLEHAVVAKLTRRSFREDADGYDVAVSLPHIDAEHFAEIVEGLRKESPHLVERIPRRLEAVQHYVEEEYRGEEAEIMMRILAELRRRLRGIA